MRHGARRHHRGIAGVACGLLLACSASCGRIGFELVPLPEPSPNAATLGDGGADATYADVSTVVDAGEATEAGPPDAGADASDAAGDANPMADAASPFVDADAGPDAAVPAPGVRIAVQDVADGTALSDYAVQVAIDTAAWIDSGRLDADCRNLSVFAGANCDVPVPFFLPEAQCGGAAADLWIKGSVPDGSERVFALGFDAASASASDGSQVFAFFDDFSGSSLDDSRWSLRGSGSVVVGGGMFESTGSAALQSQAAVVDAGASAVGIRMAANSRNQTDVELGVGSVLDTNLWAYDRSWDGLTFLSWTESAYAFDSVADSACDASAQGSGSNLGATWVDLSPAAATFLTAEFGYDEVAGHTEGWLRTSRGAAFDFTGPDGCTLPASMPIYVSLDHSDSDLPTQQVDYVYVRPWTRNAPTVQLLENSPQRCSELPGS